MNRTPLKPRHFQGEQVAPQEIGIVRQPNVAGRIRPGVRAAQEHAAAVEPKIAVLEPEIAKAEASRSFGRRFRLRGRYAPRHAIEIRIVQFPKPRVGKLHFGADFIDARLQFLLDARPADGLAAGGRGNREVDRSLARPPSRH